MKKLIDKKIVKYILDNLEEKDAFILDLISSCNQSISKNDPSIVEDCLSAWEATAELSSVPGLPEEVWANYNSLREAGFIK